MSDTALARELADQYQLRLDHDYQLKLAHFTNIGEDDLREICRLLRTGTWGDQRIYQWIEKWAHCLPDDAMADFPVDHRAREGR